MGPERQCGRRARSFSPTITTLQLFFFVALTSAAKLKLLKSGNKCTGKFVKITTAKACKSAHKAVGNGKYRGTEFEASFPSGCYYCKNSPGCLTGTWFNSHPAGKKKTGAGPYCAKKNWWGCKNGGCDSSGGNNHRDILLVGDSDIEYWHNWQTTFSDAANVGVGGWTCKQVKNNIQGFLNKYTPVWVVVVCGENDIIGRTSVSKTFSYLRTVINTVEASGARMLYIGTKPEPSTTKWHSKYREYDDMVRNHAATRAASGQPPPLVMIDSYRGFQDLGNPRSLYQNDRLHLSNSAYGYWNSWSQTALDATKAAHATCQVWQSGTCVQPV